MSSRHWIQCKQWIRHRHRNVSVEFSPDLTYAATEFLQMFENSQLCCSQCLTLVFTFFSGDLNNIPGVCYSHSSFVFDQRIFSRCFWNILTLILCLVDINCQPANQSDWQLSYSHIHQLHLLRMIHWSRHSVSLIITHGFQLCLANGSCFFSVL